MADLVLSPLVDAVIGTLLSTLIEKGRMIYQLGDDLDHLSDTFSRIRDLLQDAEERQITERSVKKWLGELKDVAYDADDVLDEIVYEALRREAEGESNKGERKRVRISFPSFSFFGPKQDRSKLDIANRVKGINERIEKIHEARDEFCFREGDGGRASERIDQLRLTTSLLTVPEFEILGRDKDSNEIIKLLLSDDSCGEKQASVISIVGMGGLGKTTLAQLVYNNPKIVNHFDIRAWVCVSEDFDVLRLTKEIIESATMENCKLSAIDPMQRHLQDILSGKRFLIVLDDVWNEKRTAWEKLSSPFTVGAKGSKILATTRGDAVSKSMNTDHLYRLDHLGDEDCLSLFLRHSFAGENFDAYPKLMKIGKELVERRCQGLPLAAKALGSLLSSERELNFWESILNSPIWGSSLEDESEVTTAMRVSYHHSPPHIKQVRSFFPSCSFFGLKQGPSKLDIATTKGDGRRANEHVGQRSLTTSLLTVPESEILGRNKDRDEIIKLLLSDDSCGEKQVSVISIVGMGGLGKTTLAQLVYNNQNVVNYFHIRAWVCVSEDFDVLRLTKEIIEFATRKNCSSTAIDPMQRDLKDILSGKRFLIVLDDVWNVKPSAWEKLGAPFRVGAKGSKIIVTTQAVAVSKSMNTNLLYHLEPLGDEDCLLLFLRHAFAGENLDAELMKIGKELVERRCEGLPRVAKALGCLIFSKREMNFWNLILNSPMWSSMEDKSEVTTAMRLIYHRLPPHINQCFAFCSIFPKDYEFEKDELVKLWIAQGFILLKGGMTLEETGSEYFKFLLSRSFFQREGEGEHKKYKMHDRMRDLAESISSDECLRIENGKATHIPRKGHRHSSFITVDRDTETVNLEDLYKCKGLRTFIHIRRIHWAVSIDSQVLNGLMENLRCLRLLVLSSLRITELPDSICKLKHLRYLDLSGTAITQLHESVSSLYNLQTLKLDFCKNLRQLPKETRKLLNLRHLCLNGCFSLEGMPSEIGGLTCLQTLSRFLVGRESGSKIRELKSLTELKGAISIAKLQNVLDAKEAEEANLKNIAFLETLEFSWDEEDAEINSHDQASFEEESEKILEALQPHSDIKELSIEGYRGKNYPSWLQDCPKLKKMPDFFPTVKRLTLRNCHQLACFPRFPSLDALWLNECNEILLRQVSNLTSLSELSIYMFKELRSFPEEMLQPLGNLKKLEISWCQKLVCLVEEDKGLPPTLASLRIVGCVNLKSLPKGMQSLTSLKDLGIFYCPKLVSLPEDGLSATLESLEICECEKLRERCQKEDGEDWAKISHIPRLMIA